MFAYNPADDEKKGKAIPPRNTEAKNEPKLSPLGAVGLILVLLMIAGFAFGCGLFAAEIVTYKIENILFPIEYYCPTHMMKVPDALPNS